MEFWGIEVKGKQSTNVTVEDFHILHLSQAVLSDAKKDNEPVTLYVKVDDKKLVLGVLSAETNPQLSFDLVFEKDFELSHNAKNACVHLLGYMSEIPLDDDEFSGPSDEEEEDVPSPQAVAKIQAAIAKARAEKASNPTNNAQAKPEAKVDDDDDDSDDDEDFEDESDDEDMVSKGDESDDDEEDDDDDDDDDEESSEEEETPVKVESGKKRKAEVKTPEPKKAKLATPQKTDGKKGAHTATPHPSKKGGKTPSGSDKSTPKSGGQLSCGPCKKTFTSDSALQSHTKSKHSGGK